MKNTNRWLLPLCLTWFCVVAASNVACAQWATPPAGITYGTPLSSAQLDSNGTGCVYVPAAGTVLLPGTWTLYATCSGGQYNTTLTVGQATLSVGVQGSPITRDYDVPNPPFAPSYSGFVNGDTAAVLSGEPIITTPATTTSPANVYPINVSVNTLSAANYIIAPVNGQLIINQPGQDSESNCGGSSGNSCLDVVVFPKYMVLGVVYAPPGSASFVSYSDSNMVGSADTVMAGSSTSNGTTYSTKVGGGFFGLGASQTNTTTDKFTTEQQNQNTFTVQTTEGNSITSMGPISSALGVDHDNDVIYIALNPALTDTASFNSGSGAFVNNLWTGLYSNSCDLNLSADDWPTFYQLLDGCDANQYPFADIIGIPVWCLKNPYYPTPSCLQWLQYTSRSWDGSYRGPAYPITTGPVTINGTTVTGITSSAFPADPTNPPGLTLQDYRDILSADPFVVVNGNTPNVCHPGYGPDFDPNLVENIYPAPSNSGSVAYVLVTNGGSYSSGSVPTVSIQSSPAPVTSTDPFPTAQALAIMNSTGTAVDYVAITNPGYGYSAPPTVTFSPASATALAILANAPKNCATTSLTNPPASTQATSMYRFDPYGAVEYPVPGPNGMPSTYSGTFLYETSTQTQNTVIDSHETGSSTDFTAGFSDSFWFANFTAQASSGSSNSNTTTTQNTNANSTTSKATADYSITGPQLSDNYDGPATYNVYKDVVYGTYAFYSDLEAQAQLGSIAIAPCVVPGTASNIASIVNSYTTFAIPDGANTGNCPLLPSTTSGTASPYSTGFNIPIPSFAEQWINTPPNPFANVSGPIPIILTNTSQYSTTMAGPAVSFSDAGFQLVENNPNWPDMCSNQQLAKYSTANNTSTPIPATPDYCTLYIQFAPQPSDANLTVLPPPVPQTGVVQASIIAAGTENVTPYENILVTSNEAVAGEVVGGTQGATLLPCNVAIPLYPTINYNNSGIPGSECANPSMPTPANPIPYIFQFGPLTESQVQNKAAEFETFIFTNNYSDYTAVGAQDSSCGTPNYCVTINQIDLTDSSDFYITSGTKACVTGQQLSQGTFCTVTVGFLPSSTDSGPYYQSAIKVMGTVYGGQTTQLAAAGVTGAQETLTVSVANIPIIGSYSFCFEENGTCYGGGWSGNGIAAPTGSITITNNSPESVTLSVSTSGWEVPNTCPASLLGGKSCTLTVTGFTGPCTYSNNQCVYSASGVVTITSSLGNITVPIAESITQTNPNAQAVKIVVHGAEQSNQVTTPATSATGTLTIKPASANPVSEKGTVSVTVGSFKATASYPAGASELALVRDLVTALNAKGSPVKATASGAVIKLTSVSAGTAGNLTIAPTGDADFGFALSGRTLTGGENATTKTVYDAGSVNLTTNGVTASAPWGSGSTPQSVAQALAASVNNVAAAYWKASASGDVVTLTSVPKAGVSKASKSQSSASDPMGVTVTDSAGFAPPSFSATTSD